MSVTLRKGCQVVNLACVVQQFPPECANASIHPPINSGLSLSRRWTTRGRERIGGDRGVRGGGAGSNASIPDLEIHVFQWSFITNMAVWQFVKLRYPYQAVLLGVSILWFLPDPLSTTKWSLFSSTREIILLEEQH